MRISIKYYVLGIMGILLLYIIHTTSYIIPTVYAAVDIGKEFGYGDIKSLGEGTSRLVLPAFSLAAVLVIIYFLIGAFKYLKSGGNKEEVQGAREMITHAIIGFILLMFTFLVIQYLMFRLFGLRGFQIF